MASIEQLKDSIAPGSTEYGERQVLEQNLAQASNATGGGGIPSGAGAAPAAAGGPMPPGPESPLGMLLSGELPPNSTPLTDGLSVGPGAGPAEEANPWTDDYSEALRYLAQFAKTPQLRAQARAALRLRVRGAEIQ